MSQLACGAIMLREVAVRQATSAISYMNHMVVLTVLHLIRNVHHRGSVKEAFGLSGDTPLL